jgi:hypothetical protein
MLGRKDYTQQEVDEARTTIDRQLASYKRLAKAANGNKAALDAFEPLFFNNLTLALDRFFVHRIRKVTGNDGNPLNEVELLVDSLLGNGGELRGSGAIKYEAEESVLKLEVGDRIALSETQFESLYSAFMADLEAKFVHEN